MRRSFRTVSKVTVGLLTGSAVAFAVFYTALIAGGYKPVAVYSGSMTPTIAVGGLAVDRPISAKEVRVGDVITFTDPYNRGRTVTHRVIAVIRTAHGLAYRTKGDANPDRDPWTIRLSGQVGRVAFRIPVAGYVLVYAHTREVRSALVVLAAGPVLFGLLRRIGRTD